MASVRNASDSALRIVAAVAFLGFVAIWASLNLTKGAWFDEIFTLAAARHDMPLLDIIGGRLSDDVHPPFFLLLAWLIEPIVGQNVVVGRFLNIAVIAVAVATIAGLTRNNRTQQFFATVVVVVLFSAQPLLSAALEYRSTSISLSANAVIVVVLFMICTNENDYSRSDMRTFVTLIITLLVVLSFHYLAAAQSFGLCMIFAVGLALSGRRRWAIRVGLAVVATSLPLALWFWHQHELMVRGGQTFYATTTPRLFINYSVGFLKSVLLANLVVTSFAVHGFASVPISRLDRHNAFLAIVTIAVLACFFSMFILNIFRPFLVAHYLEPLTPYLAAIIAGLAIGSWPNRKFLTAGLVGLGTMTGLWWSSHHLDHQPGWEVSGRIVASLTRACPTSVVRSVPHWVADPRQRQHAPSEFGTYGVVDWQQRRLATILGFNLDTEHMTAIDGRCPAIIWTEHVFDDVDVRAMMRGAGLAIKPGKTVEYRLLKAGTGRILLVGP